MVTIMKICTLLAVGSWCLAAYMLPVVALIVWLRRKHDPTEIIQTDVDDVVVTDDWLRCPGDE